jgi:hypothetical protein
MTKGSFMKNYDKNNTNPVNDDIDEVLKELDALVNSLGTTVDGTSDSGSEKQSEAESVDLRRLDLGHNVEIHPMAENEGSVKIFDSIRKKLDDLDVTSTKIELYLSELATAVNQ